MTKPFFQLTLEMITGHHSMAYPCSTDRRREHTDIEHAARHPGIDVGFFLIETHPRSTNLAPSEAQYSVLLLRECDIKKKMEIILRQGVLWAADPNAHPRAGISRNGGGSRIFS